MRFMQISAMSAKGGCKILLHTMYFDSALYDVMLEGF